MVLVRRERSPCRAPIVVLSSGRKPIWLVHENLSRDARAYEDGVDFGRLDLSRVVELLQTNVRIRILQVGGKVLVLEDSVEHACHMYD